jgi:hypothetical protein
MHPATTPTRAAKDAARGDGIQRQLCLVNELHDGVRSQEIRAGGTPVADTGRRFWSNSPINDHRVNGARAHSHATPAWPCLATSEGPAQASVMPCAESGRERTGLPSISASALASAGAITGVPGSPTPVGLFLDGTMWVSMAGIWLMRSTG